MLSRFSAPLLGRRSPLRLRSLRSGGKSAPIFHLSTICFPQSFPRCGENVHLPVRFSPPFRFPPPGAPIPSRRGEEKSPSRARIYNIGAEKGEKGSAPFAAFRGGRGLLAARGAERWPRPAGKGLTGGRGSQKGVGECVGSGRPGGARRGGASESGRSGALRLHPSRNGRRGTGAPRPMRLHNSRSILSIVSE